MKLDLADLDSVVSFAEQFNAMYDRLYILMNNAGIALMDYSETV